MKTRQELLDYLLNKEMEELRKRCFKYKRRPFLKNKVTIIEADLSNIPEDGAAGLYERINEINEYKFEHKISIDSSVIDNYLKCRNKDFVTKDNYKSYKNFYKRNLVKVIKHELTHAFVSEYFEPFSEIKGTDRDASPIFLSVLEFFYGYSNHECSYDFENGSEIYIDITSFVRNFEQLEKYITKLMLQYEKVCGNLKDKKEIGNGFIKSVSNHFEYASRHAGLFAKASYESNYICVGKRGNINDNINFFEIGCNITPNMVKRLVERKINSKNFERLLIEKSFYDVNKQMFLTKERDGKLSKKKIEIPKSA